MINVLKGCTVLITGGTGTFGQAFTRHALVQEAKQVRIFSRDELKQSEMEASKADSRIKFICGDVRDEDRILRACQGVNVVVHAAAMKRLETCEREPLEAVKTNVTGSINVAKACRANGVSHAIALSSDKAVHPANTYGKTKSLMENIWIQGNDGFGDAHNTRFSVVRYGNVMGSRGSVADIFKKQAHQGSVKVTDPDMTRFFMPVEYATDLVDFAIKTQQGGEIFVPMLKSTTIGVLAKVIAKSCPVVVVGPKPGEKTHEDIITEKEMIRASIQSGVAVVDPEWCTWPYKFKEILTLADNTSRNFPMRSCDAQKLTEGELEALIATNGTIQGFGGGK